MSKFYVYNRERERIGEIQQEESTQWLENYQGVGEAKIIARATPDNISFLVEGNRIFNVDSVSVGIIRYVDITEHETENTITARMVLSAHLLNERVVMATEKVTGVEAALRRIYQSNQRGLPIELASSNGFSQKLDTEITWNSVLDAFVSICEQSGLGFRVSFDPVSGKETLEIYEGVDRTNSSTQENLNYVGYLSPQIGDIHDIQIIYDHTDYKNVAVVAGEDSAENRVIRIVSLGNFSGENRRELYVDARDLQKEYQVAHPTGEMDDKGNPIYTYEQKTYTDAEYAAILEARGYEKLAEHLEKFMLTCKVDQNNMVYGEDYFLGDRMPVKIPEYGIDATAVISSALCIYERGGKSVEVTLSQFELR